LVTLPALSCAFKLHEQHKNKNNSIDVSDFIVKCLFKEKLKQTYLAIVIIMQNAKLTSFF